MPQQFRFCIWSFSLVFFSFVLHSQYLTKKCLWRLALMSSTFLFQFNFILQNFETLHCSLGQCVTWMLKKLLKCHFAKKAILGLKFFILHWMLGFLNLRRDKLSNKPLALILWKYAEKLKIMLSFNIQTFYTSKVDFAIWDYF